MRANWIGALAAGAAAVVFGLLLLARDPLLFWNDDYELSVLPVCTDMARAWRQGEVPLLSPYSWICGNLAGEFQYGVFSIFVNALIVAVWQFPLTFPQQAAALSIPHLAILAAGGFMLARGRNLSAANSIFVGLIAALNGWIICWGATDWLGALAAFAWLPWAWWAAERALDPARSRWRFLWPAPFVYLLVTGGFPYTVLMFALVLAWLATRALIGTIDPNRPAHARLANLLPLIAGVALGIGLAAPAWLALLDCVQGSARVVLNPLSHFQWLVPPSAWPGLVLPNWTVNWSDFSSRMMPHTANELACGLVPPAALAAGFFVNGPGLWPKLRWDLALLAIVFVLAMLPTAGVFRWSFRWLPLFHLILGLCAAEALQGDNVRSRAPFFALGLLAIVSGAMLIFRFGGDYAVPLAWTLLAIALGWCALQDLKSVSLRQWTPPAIVFVALLATYVCIPPNCGVPKYDLPQTLLKPQPLDPHRLYLSIYPAAETAYRVGAKTGPVGQTVRLGSASMWAGLRFVNGYSPIRPVGVAREFASAIHGEIDPNMAEWLLANEAHADGLLERLGIDGIVVANEFTMAPPTSNWHLFSATNEGRIFHRRGDSIPTVRSVDFFQRNAIARVSAISESRLRASAFIDVPAGDRPALIAFSRPFFRGYRARIGKLKLPVFAVRNLIPLVEVPAGTSGKLTIAYRPAWLLYGGSVALVCAAIWIGSALMAGTEKVRAG
jgi:hypothetical protein